MKVRRPRTSRAGDRRRRKQHRRRRRPWLWSRSGTLLGAPALAVTLLWSASAGGDTTTSQAAGAPASLPRLPRPVAGPLVAATTGPPDGAPFDGTPAVGALFTADGSGLGRHFCTASVVESPSGDLALTAAHCVRGREPAGIVFVPGYYEGREPYGTWHVTAVITDAAWSSSADPDDDFAFLVLGRSGGDGSVEEVTGGERVGSIEADGQLAEVEGYPDGEERPIACENRVMAFGRAQLVFDCGGYTDGTSGGPFLTDVDPRTGLGTVVGVIGGYEQGGYTPQVSYAARFGPSLEALYRVAVERSAPAGG